MHPLLCVPRQSLSRKARIRPEDADRDGRNRKQLRIIFAPLLNGTLDAFTAQKTIPRDSTQWQRFGYNLVFFV